MHHATKEKDPLFISVALPGSGRGQNQANNKIGLDEITLPQWLMILQSLEPPGTKNAHLSDVRSAAEVKLTLKSQTTNAYGSVLL